MDIGRGITYIFEDRDWLKKVAIGGLITLIPILNLAAYGYYLTLLRQLMGGSELPLPEWDEIGQKLVDGLILSLILLVWSLPALILMGFSIVPLMGAALTSQGDSQAAGFAALGGMVIFMGLGGIYLFLLAIVMPAIILNYAREGTFGSGFKFGQIFGYLTANLGGYFLLLAIMVGVSFAVAVVGSILSFIPLLGQVALIFLGFMATLIYAHYLAQYYRANFAASQPPASAESGAY